MYETSGHFPYYRESQFSPMFGHPAGQLVDYWKTQLVDGTLNAAAESDFLAAAKEMGCPFDDYPIAKAGDEKLPTSMRGRSSRSDIFSSP